MLFVLPGALLAPALANGVNGAVRQLPSWIDKLNAFTQQHFNTGQLAGAVFGLLTVGLFTFYLTANGPQVRRALRSRMPPERQQRVLWAWWNLSSPASRSRSHPNGSH